MCPMSSWKLSFKKKIHYCFSKFALWHVFRELRHFLTVPMPERHWWNQWKILLLTEQHFSGCFLLKTNETNWKFHIHQFWFLAHFESALAHCAPVINSTYSALHCLAITSSLVKRRLFWFIKMLTSKIFRLIFGVNTSKMWENHCIMCKGEYMSM